MSRKAPLVITRYVLATLVPIPLSDLILERVVSSIKRQTESSPSVREVWLEVNKVPLRVIEIVGV